MGTPSDRKRPSATKTRRKSALSPPTEISVSPANPTAAKTAILHGALLLLMTLAAYLPAMRAGYIWDDDALSKNRWVHSPAGLAKIWFEPSGMRQWHEEHYWPLVYTSFWIEARFWGEKPFGYHFDNVLLHAASALLLWHILRRMGVPGAWLAGALFALHPTRVESVAWVIERKDVLSALFYLLAFRAYWIFSERRVRRDALLSALFYVAAMLSKSVTLTLPIALGLALFWKHRHLPWDLLWPLAAMLLTGIAIALLDVRWVRSANAPIPWDLSFLQRILIAARTILFYSGKLFWPANLMTIYPRWSVSVANPADYIHALALLAVAAALWLARRGIGLAPLLALLFFAVTLAPNSGLVDYGFMEFTFVADRFQYLAGIGLIVLAAAEAAQLAARMPAPTRRLARPAIFLLLGLLGTFSFRQVALYRDTETLFTYNLTKNEKAWFAHNCLGSVQVEQGRLDEAIAHFDEAIRLRDGNYPDALNNLGLAYNRQNKPEKAIEALNQVIAAKPDADAADALNNLGWAYARQGRLNEALQYLNRSLAAKPDYPEALNNLGSVLGQAGKLVEAANAFDRALASQPDYPDALYNRGVTRLQQGRRDLAARDFERALALRPGFTAAAAQLQALRAR